MTSQDEKREKILQLGREMGWTETRALANITFINGNPVLYADGLTSILHEAGHKLTEVFSGDVDDGDYKAEITIERHDTGTIVTRSFSVAQAKRAGLWDERPTVIGYTDGHTGAEVEVPNDNPWYKYPERMIWRRAIGWGVRDACSDQLYGMQIKEEVEDYTKSVAATEAVKAKPSRLAEKLANLAKTDDEVPPKQVDERAPVSPQESREDFALPEVPDFKKRLEAFTEHYGRGGKSYGVERREEPTEPEVLFWKGVTYRVYRDIKLGFDPEKPEADYDRIALNDEGFLHRFSLSMIEHVNGSLNEKQDLPAEDAKALQGASSEAGEKTASETAPNGSDAVAPPEGLSEASRQWLIDISEETTELKDIEKTWKRERKLPWYKELPQSEKDYLLSETRRIIKAIKAEAGA